MPFNIGKAPDLTDASIQKVHIKSMPIRRLGRWLKKRLTSDGYMYEPKTAQEVAERKRNLEAIEKAKKELETKKKKEKMMKTAGKGLTSKEEYELRMKNIRAKRLKKEQEKLEADPSVKKWTVPYYLRKK